MLNEYHFNLLNLLACNKQLSSTQTFPSICFNERLLKFIAFGQTNISCVNPNNICQHRSVSEQVESTQLSEELTGIGAIISEN